jgi:Relaxase/Mobilisation nuclease domain
MQSRNHSRPLFDLVSHARRGPGRRDQLSPAQVEQVARTVRRVPEVMVKVLPRGVTTLSAAQSHLAYIGRDGDLDLETHDGEKLRGSQVSQKLLEDWDLDLDDHRRQPELGATRGKGPPRLVHKVMFSMPAGTPPQKVLTAVQSFCREEFALKHRYVMALHTDEPHPHVHVVIKAVDEQGQRLHIRKATLREWRSEFARHLRTLGVPANATDRYVRGETKPRKSDGIYRSAERGASSHIRRRVLLVAAEMQAGAMQVEPAKAKLLQTREQIERGWRAVRDMLSTAGRLELAAEVRQFVANMPSPRTEKEILAAALLERTRGTRAKSSPEHTR